MTVAKLLTALRELPFVRSAVAEPDEVGWKITVHKYIRLYRRPLQMSLIISDGILDYDPDTVRIVSELLQEAEDSVEPPVYT